MIPSPSSGAILRARRPDQIITPGTTYPTHPPKLRSATLDFSLGRPASTPKATAPGRLPRHACSFSETLRLLHIKEASPAPPRLIIITFSGLVALFSKRRYNTYRYVPLMLKRAFLLLLLSIDLLMPLPQQLRLLHEPCLMGRPPLLLGSPFIVCVSCAHCSHHTPPHVTRLGVSQPPCVSSPCASPSQYGIGPGYLTAFSLEPWNCVLLFGISVAPPSGLPVKLSRGPSDFTPCACIFDKQKAVYQERGGGGGGGGGGADVLLV